MSTLHVGLVGCGKWGQYILRDLKLLGATVAVVARSDESRARAAAGGAEAIVGDIASLPAVDAIYVASTIASHADVLEAVVDRGVPIFCEKPLTDDADRAESLAARAGERLFVLDKWRYHPAIVEIGRIARSGELGPVIGVSTRRLGWGNAHPDSSALWVLAPHDLSIGLEILGSVPPLRAAVLDGVDGSLSGVSALLADTSVWLSIEISERSVERVRSVRLMCRDGSAALSGAYADHLAVHRFEVGGKMRPCEFEKRPVSEDWPLKIMLGETLGFLRGGPPPKTSGRDGAMIVRRLSEMLGAAFPV